MKTPILRVIIFLLLLQDHFGLAAQPNYDLDSVLYFPNNQFIRDYLVRGENGNISIPRFDIEKVKIDSKIPFNDFNYINTGNDLYLTVTKTGRVYKMVASDSSQMKFLRIDHTTDINYNIGAMIFPYKDHLYSFSGYGYWKTTGQLRKYNFQGLEWDIVPLNKEITPQIFPSPSTWYDVDEGKIYMLYKSIMNAGLKGSVYIRGKNIEESYILDLNTRDWQYLGRTNPKLINIVANSYSTLSSNKGSLHLSFEDVYWLDVKNNLGYKLESTILFQELGRIFKNNICYLRDTTLYYYSFKLDKYDSLKIELSTKVEEFPLVYKNPSSDFPLIYVFSTTVAILLIIYLIYRRKKKQSKKDEILFENESHLELTTLEKNLIELLMGKKGNSATIQEVNYVLGLKNKNVGLQKKVRSDVINSINEKYSKKSGNKILLVQSIRSESDKRIFEYIIDMNRANEFLATPNDQA